MSHEHFWAAVKTGLEAGGVAAPNINPVARADGGLDVEFPWAGLITAVVASEREIRLNDAPSLLESLVNSRIAAAKMTAETHAKYGLGGLRRAA